MATLEDQAHIIDVINERREYVGISATELSKRLGMGEARLGYLLRNERNIFGPELVTLCAYFGIGVEELMVQGDVALARKYGAPATAKAKRH